MTPHLIRRPEGAQPQPAAIWLLALLLVLLTAAVTVAEDKLPLQKLDGPARARIFAALAGLVILGLFLVLFAIWAASFTRRYMRSGQPLPPTGRSGDDDWAGPPRTLSKSADSHDSP